MATLSIYIAALCLVLLAVIKVLELVHVMGMIEKRWPKMFSTLTHPRFRTVLIVIAIALLAEAIWEHQQEKILVAPETPKAEPKIAPEPPKIEPKIEQKAKDSPCANVAAGRDATVNCSPPSEDINAKKGASKKP